jgi:hypothetical protein
MAVSGRFAPGKAIRWRKRRFVVVDCAALDTIIVREVGKRGLERIRPASQSQIMCLVQSHTICGKSRPVAFNLPIDTRWAISDDRPYRDNYPVVPLTSDF